MPKSEPTEYDRGYCDGFRFKNKWFYIPDGFLVGLFIGVIVGVIIKVLAS